MPITEKEQAKLKELLGKLSTPAELLKLTGNLYDTILHANIQSQPLMTLGKLIYARTGWKDLVAEWKKLGGDPTHLNEKIRLPLLRSCEEFFVKELTNVFEIVPEPIDVAEEIADSEAAALAGGPVAEEFTNPPEDELDPAPPGTKPQPKAAKQQQPQPEKVVEQPAANPIEAPPVPVEASQPEQPKSNGASEAQVPLEETISHAAPVAQDDVQ